MSFIEENIEVLTNLENKLPNDMEFGNELRRLFFSEKYVLSIPNDQELGKTVRKIVKKF